MSIQWVGDGQQRRDVAHVRQLAVNASREDELGQPYVDADPHLMRWVLLIGLASCVIAISVFALIAVTVVRHWVGLAQFSLAAAVVWLVALGIDWLYSAPVRNWKWFR